MKCIALFFLLSTLTACAVTDDPKEPARAPTSTPQQELQTLNRVSFRYIVTDVDAAIAFYTKQLGFELLAHPAPGFAALQHGPLRLLLNAPGAGGAGQAASDGRRPEPGGWNRIQLEVRDLETHVEKLRESGAHFRSDLIKGNGGIQILVEDPSGNPIELFEPYTQQTDR